MGDVYAYEVKLDNNDYGMECGDSWVVAAENLTPRRGIIMGKSIGDNGVVFTSSGEVESYILDNGQNYQKIKEIISEVDSLYNYIDISEIVLPDGTSFRTEYQFSSELTSYDNNGVSFDLKDQFDDFVSGLNDLLVYVNGEPATINITNRVLTISYIQTPEDYIVNKINVMTTEATASTGRIINLDDIASSNYIKGNKLDTFEPLFSSGGFIIGADGWRFNNSYLNNEWTVLKTNGGSYFVWVLLRLIDNQGWVNVVDGKITVGNESVPVTGYEYGSGYNCHVKYSSSEKILYVEYYK